MFCHIDIQYGQGFQITWKPGNHSDSQAFPNPSNKNKFNTDQTILSVKWNPALIPNHDMQTLHKLELMNLCVNNPYIFID